MDSSLYLKICLLQQSVKSGYTPEYSQLSISQVKVHLKLIISQRKLSRPRKLDYFDISVVLRLELKCKEKIEGISELYSLI